MTERLWNAEELCSFLGWTRKQLYSARYRGWAPPAFRLGKSLRWEPAQVRAWLESHADGTARR